MRALLFFFQYINIVCKKMDCLKKKKSDLAGFRNFSPLCLGVIKLVLKKDKHREAFTISEMIWP